MRPDSSPVTNGINRGPIEGNGEVFRPAPTLDLRFDFRNPIRSSNSRRIATLGNIKSAIVYDFIGMELREGNRGAQVVQLLGSFPGFLYPNTPLGQWDPDQKPDVNIVGDADVILGKLAPMMGWDGSTLEANLHRTRQGMVYFNLALETPEGPVPFKMGVLDSTLWRNGGHPYYDLRSSLLQANGPSYVYLDEDLGEAGKDDADSIITRTEFEPRLRQVQQDYIRRSMETFLFRRSFTAQDLVQRRYRNQFANYELYRIFDWFKGPKQAERYRERIPGIIAPALRSYLEANPKAFSVHHAELGVITPDQISPENFSGLVFSSNLSFGQRLLQWLRSHGEFLRINGRLARQTFRNIGSNRTSRPGYHKVGWVKYGARKFGRFLGMNGNHITRNYASEASHFTTDAQRLGKSDNPIRQAIVIGGYPPGDETDPEVFRKLVDYGEAEIVKGKRLNVMFYGNHPNKPGIGIGGVPSLSTLLHRLMSTEGLEDVTVVGTRDLGIQVNAFKSYFADRLRESGTPYDGRLAIKFAELGPEGGGFAENINVGKMLSPYPHDRAVLTYADTPLIDPEIMMHHPWRHNVDFSMGVNGRDMLLDFLGMNAHLQVDADGRSEAFKEGNAKIVQFIHPMVQEVYDNRKSVISGAIGKVILILQHSGLALAKPKNWPAVIDYANVLADVAVRSVYNLYQKKFSDGKRPPVSFDIGLVEHGSRSIFDWQLDLRPQNINPGHVPDLDGVRDLATLMLHRQFNEKDPAYQELLRFVDEELRPLKAQYPTELSALDGTPQRVNEMYRRFYEEVLRREGLRPKNLSLGAGLKQKAGRLVGQHPAPTEKRAMGLTEARLKQAGVDPDNLPFLENGELNPAWVRLAFTEEEIQNIDRSFRAYDNRLVHASGLQEAFDSRWGATQPYERPLLISPAAEAFVHQQIISNPDYFRGLVLEWEMDRIENEIVQRAEKKFGKDTSEIQQVRKYFRVSWDGNQDSSLRRLLLGLKSADSLFRYSQFLSPSEYQSLFPRLVESLHLMGEGSPALKNWLYRQQRFADRNYVRKVGESPPPYRSLYQFPGMENLILHGSESPVFPRTIFPHSNSRPPLVRDASGKVVRADSQAFLPHDINLMALRLGVMPERIPHMIHEAAGSLETLPNERISFERLLAWSQSRAGQEYLRSNTHRVRDTLWNRSATHGPALGVGIGTLLLAEQGADLIGLDPMRNPHERFMFVVGASHLANVGAGSLMEVLGNRRMGLPFDFVTQRSINVGGEAGIQFSLHSRGSTLRALGASLARNYNLQGGIGRMAWNGTKGLATLPFRASWHMGAGLMSSALTDRIVSEGILDLPQDSGLRRGIHFGSFFLPEIGRIALGNRVPRIFNSPAMRFANRAFAVGFMADMAFSAQNRIANGSEGATRMSMLYGRANQLHDAAEGNGLVEGAFELVAPQLAAWWSSVEFHGLSLQPNQYRRQAEEEMSQFTSQVDAQARRVLRSQLLDGFGSEGYDPNFYTRVEMEFLKVDLADSKELPTELWREDLENGEEIRDHFSMLETTEQQVRFLQNHFSGWNLSREDALRVLDETACLNLRNELGQLSQIPYTTTSPLQTIFDDTGRLQAGQEGRLLRTVFENPDFGPRELLQTRKARLALKIMLLEEEGGSPSTARELTRLREVARKVGLLDASQQWTEDSAVAMARRQFSHRG